MPGRAADASRRRERQRSMIRGRFFLFQSKTLRWFSIGCLAAPQMLRNPAGGIAR